MKRGALLPALLAVAFLLRPAGAAACSPSLPEVVFAPRSISSIPLERFLDGELGVLQPGYGLPQLWPAYRVLLGRGITAAERRALRELAAPVVLQDRRETSPIAEWLAERGKVAGTAPPPGKIDRWAWSSGIYRHDEKPGEWRYFLNCPGDAFRRAAATLRERAGRVGASGPELLAWVGAQDAVFSNCAEGRAIPEPAPAGADPLVLADRAYQVAAAHFYAEEYDEAEGRFRAISADPASPWRDLAAYLVGRTLLRKAVVPGTPGSPPDKERLRAAAEQFATLLADPARVAVHGPAASHLKLVRAYQDPSGYLAGFGAGFAVPADDPGILERFREYSYLMRGRRWQGELQPTGDDLSEWLTAMWSMSARPRESQWAPVRASGALFRHAFAAWQRTNSLPWLIAALTAADAGHPETPRLLEAGAAVAADSPAYATVAYLGLRLTIDAGKLDAGRATADRLLANPGWSAADRNLLLAERLRAARSLEEFLRDTPRLPVGVDNDGGITLLPSLPSIPFWPDERFKALFDGRMLLDQDAASTMDAWFPLPLLARAAASPELPAHLRRELARALFVRAVLLADHDAARAVVPALRELAPELDAGLARYLAARGEEEPTFAAAVLMLEAPGMQPSIRSGAGRRTPIDRLDSLRDNWWYDLRRQPAPAGSPPAFLSAGQLADLSREREKLRGIPAAPEYLGGVVLAWARAHRDDARVPEALHLVVRAGHFGMAPPKLPTSRAAFELLHRRYPDSDWAARTPYWY